MMIQQKFPLNFQWPTVDPFLFCVHHSDQYPQGDSRLGLSPDKLRGRALGQDFDPNNNFRMYHGNPIPGFPVHPHRGFETITIVRRGYIDHADSMGAAGRYGEGDVQWMTAGRGVQHSEMFPLIHQDQENPVELFQIWLNLPRKSKMTDPHFTMFWSENIPKVFLDQNQIEINVIAGEFNGTKSLNPPPESWASDEQNQVSILLIKMKAGSSLTLPKANKDTLRTIYFFQGQRLSINQDELPLLHGALLKGENSLPISALDQDCEFLLLQSAPIGEPVYQHGPFVMNTRQEIVDTIEDYQKTQFGGWPWPSDDMTHGPKLERFARHPEGQIDRPASIKTQL